MDKMKDEYIIETTNMEIFRKYWPEEDVINWSWADSKVEISGFFSKDHRKMVVKIIITSVKENCPHNLL